MQSSKTQAFSSSANKVASLETSRENSILLKKIQIHLLLRKKLLFSVNIYKMRFSQLFSGLATSFADEEKAWILDDCIVSIIFMKIVSFVKKNRNHVPHRMAL